MKSRIILSVFCILTIASMFLLGSVNVNYDLEKYLPEDSEITKGLNLYHEEFGESSFAVITFDETSVQTTLSLKSEIEAIENVTTVIYIDDYLDDVTYGLIREGLDPTQQAMLDGFITNSLANGLTYTEALIALKAYLPLEQQSQLQSIIDQFISEDEMFIQVIFNEKSTSPNVESSLDSIKTLLEDKNYEYYIAGNAASSIYVRNTIQSEVFLITIICIPLVLAVLLITSKSYFDIVTFGIVVGISIIINLGTNAFLPDISFITQSMAIALQLAISLDYVVFFLGAYHQEKKQTDDVDLAIKHARKRAIKPIIASASTTAASFIALVFMRFSIGFDIGIVFAKAIIISLVTTLLLLPILLKLFHKIITKTTKKRSFEFKGKLTQKLLKFRYVFLLLLFIVLGGSIYFQTQNNYTYGAASFAGSEGTSYQDHVDHIESSFGQSNHVILMIPKNDTTEAIIYQDLLEIEYIEDVNAGIYYKLITTDPNMIAQKTERLYSENFALITFNLKSEIEGDVAFGYYEALNQLMDDYNLDEYHILGDTATAYHIRDTVSVDYNVVMMIALVAIMMIIFIAFRNVLLPVILPVVIETSVLFTMALLSMINPNTVFLAALVVSAILLGVTIDYAILLSKSYMTERDTFDKAESTRRALNNTAMSITTSALLFAIAGLSITVISSITTIRQIGLILAIGAIVSLFYILIILPQLLSIFDKWIIKSKMN